MGANQHIPNLVFVLLAAFAGNTGHAQGFAVSLRVTVESGSPVNTSQHNITSVATQPGAPEPVVAWLTPVVLADRNAQHLSVPPQDFVLTQRDKQFSPHLLVIPTGARVEFPNLDPFFHNVFSLFNGRRFDLGLYESGSRRSVRFDHEGVSYIFCNIHPEMGAVILSLSTPYYATSDQDHSILIRDVPPGDYNVHLWSENVSPPALASAGQRVRVSTQDLHLPPVILRRAPSPPESHLNKFGEEYKRPDQDPY